MTSVATRETTKGTVARYVQARLMKETSEKRGVAARIAEATGFSTAHVANAKNKGTVGQDFAEAMAKFWGFEDYAALTRAANGEEEPPAPPAVSTVVERTPRYPNQALAAQFAADAGLPLEAIGIVNSVELKSDSDLTALEWLDMIKLEAQKLKFTRKDPTASEREIQLSDAAKAEARAEHARRKAEAKKRPVIDEINQAAGFMSRLATLLNKGEVEAASELMPEVRQAYNAARQSAGITDFSKLNWSDPDAVAVAALNDALVDLGRTLAAAVAAKRSTGHRSAG